jgi:hypothetical protein
VHEHSLPRGVILITWLVGQLQTIVRHDIRSRRSSTGAVWTFAAVTWENTTPTPPVLSTVALHPPLLFIVHHITNRRLPHSGLDLAMICLAQSKYAEAEDLNERALAIREKVFGKTHVREPRLTRPPLRQGGNR